MILMKKIIKIILLTLSLVLLTACLEEVNTTKYESSNYYESKVISATKEVDRNTISVLNNEDVVGSAVVIKEERKGLDYLYYAVTTLENVESDSIKVYINSIHNKIEVIDLYKNDTYNLAVLTFNVKNRIRETKVFNKDNKIKDIFVGQSILSVGSDSRLENVNNTKLGTISSINNEEYMRSEEHTSELQSRPHLVCRLLLEKKKKKKKKY